MHTPGSAKTMKKSNASKIKSPQKKARDAKAVIPKAKGK